MHYGSTMEAQLSVVCLLVSTKNTRFVEWPSPLSSKRKSNVVKWQPCDPCTVDPYTIEDT